MLIVSPQGASKMAILWNSVTVFLKGETAIKPRDRCMWQENPETRELEGGCTAARLLWVGRRAEDEEVGKAFRGRS